MKRGELALNYIFIIFISLIAVFVVVALIAKWSLNTDTFVSRMFKEDKPVEGIQIVELRSCDTAANEIGKHIKLCQKRGKDGLARGGLCYALDATKLNQGPTYPTLPGCFEVEMDEILDAYGYMIAPPGPDDKFTFEKVIIGYDMASGNVTVI